MALRRISLLFLLLLISSSFDFLGAAQARPLPTLNQERYVKAMATLGIVCQCCDGAGGACRSTWDSTCSKLDCHPWKFF